ncbi:small GTPase [Heterostelium album PN500]|uniref:small monomeric GTPase n=1 Tax=Heterostelium pallidum (strain ATCC 26659 / Pp 5 / PN500) TaxID=670386 RepID=D3BIE8_HETP5|nr:small GTPase [Heterostelium album PN500]EFA79048.1 small GTPase [Heterostelium album PN500]|eukprot:XP_020431171.1 small GTPase [Heterostelium album PN500]
MGNNASKKKKVTKVEIGADVKKEPIGFVQGKQYKLVMLGQGGVGKTSISIRFVSDRFVTDYDPTVEDAYKKDYQIDGKEITLEILDTAGQEEYASGVQDKSIRVGEGFICIYSITSKESFQRLKDLREKILWAKDSENIPMIIVGNKCDMEKDRQVPASEGKALADEFHCPFIETSAKTNTNVKDCMDLVLKEISKYNYE